MSEKNNNDDVAASEQESTNRVSSGQQPSESSIPVVRDGAATPQAPVSTLARDEANNETETRRVRISSDLLQQKHNLIEIMTSIIVLVIIALYFTFVVTIGCLLLSKSAFQPLPTTSVVLVALTGSIPTILSITLMVGLFGKDKDDKPAIDTATAVKIAGELLKYLKSH